MPRRFYINSKMFRPPKPSLPTGKSNPPKVSPDYTTYYDGNDQRATTLYVPRQVFMSDDFDTAANNNSSVTNASLLDQPILITKKSNDTVVIKKGEIHEFQKSGDSENWSPLMDGVVEQKNLSAYVIGNCSHSSVKSREDSEKVIDQKMVKFLDNHIDKILYGSSKRRLPIFRQICPE